MTHALFSRPDSIAEAVDLLSDGLAVPLAGGTDYFAGRVGQLPSGRLVDLTGIAALRGVVRQAGGGWRIGGATTWRDILRADLPPAFDALKQAAREVGGLQVQNAGTIAGNLCNASPAADGVPPLLALDAQVELCGTGGLRTLPLAAFLTGPRRTARRPGELLTAILVPAGAAARRSHFLKLGARRYLLISIVMVAAGVEVDSDGRIVQAAVAVGACSPVACRLLVLEQRLRGIAVADLMRWQVQAEDLDGLAPIDDVRARGSYRLAAAAELIRRAVLAASGA
jgi:CO/xanthine dehydrogenase FAD-binding subunit